MTQGFQHDQGGVEDWLHGQPEQFSSSIQCQVDMNAPHGARLDLTGARNFIHALLLHFVMSARNQREVRLLYARFLEWPQACVPAFLALSQSADSIADLFLQPLPSVDQVDEPHVHGFE